MSTQPPSPAAMRAADQILEKIFPHNKAIFMDEVAAIIERETQGTAIHRENVAFRNSMEEISSGRLDAKDIANDVLNKIAAETNAEFNPQPELAIEPWRYFHKGDTIYRTNGEEAAFKHINSRRWTGSSAHPKSVVQWCLQKGFTEITAEECEKGVQP